MAGMHANGTGDPTRHPLVPGAALNRPAPVRSRAARLRRGLVISVLTLAGLTLLAEGWLRAADVREKALAAGVNRTNARWMALLSAGIFEEIDDPVRHYAMRPDAETTVEGWTFRTTSHRTRGPELPLEKPAGERRLLCIGDSFAFGLWADEDVTLVGHLARLANRTEVERGSGERWRAVNLGVPGYHTGQQLRALEQDGLALDPDAVVLYFNSNDIVREGLFLSDELGALYSDHLPLLPVGMRRFLWQHSYVYGWITRSYTQSYASIPSPQFDPRVPWSHARADNQEATAAALRRIAELCAERGIPLFWVHQPLLTWSGDYHHADWPGLELVAWAEGVRAELGVPGISLLSAFRGYLDGVDRFPDPPDEGFVLERFVADEAVQAYFRGATDVEPPDDPDFHLTGEGYGWIAGMVYPAMQRAGVLP
jgi:lysophospholipase L1-like esterase